MTTEERAFVAALDANPGCLVSRAAYSDWLQEHDDLRCRWFAFSADLGLWPTPWKMPAWFSPKVAAPLLVPYAPCESPHILPVTLFRQLKNVDMGAVCKQYDSRREADDDAAAAFLSLPPIAADSLADETRTMRKILKWTT